MHQIAYVSEATDKMNQNDMKTLMRHSRKNNASNDLTGMLLVEWPIFLQILEGPKDAIDHLLDKLEEDDRHKNLRIIYDKPDIQEREFSRWQMGCKILGEKFNEDFADLDSRVKSVLKNAQAEEGQAAHKLLLDFRKVEKEYIDI